MQLLHEVQSDLFASIQHSPISSSILSNNKNNVLMIKPGGLSVEVFKLWSNVSRTISRSWLVKLVVPETADLTFQLWETPINSPHKIHIICSFHAQIERPGWRSHYVIIIPKFLGAIDIYLQPIKYSRWQVKEKVCNIFFYLDIDYLLSVGWSFLEFHTSPF